MLNLFEMSNIRKSRTNLPVNIWVDEAKSYVRERHGKRIKYQLNSADKWDNNQPVGVMTLDGEIIENTKSGKKVEISSNEENQVKNFVLNNQYALSKLSDELIDKEDFMQVIIKGGEPATEEEINNQIQQVDTLSINETLNEDINTRQYTELENSFLDFVQTYHNNDWDWIDENSLDVELVDVFLDYIWREEYFQIFEDMFNQCINMLQQTNDYEKTLKQLIDDCYDFCDLYLEDYIDVYEPLDVYDVYHLAILLTKYICGVE